jgi:hypothetical protein
MANSCIKQKGVYLEQNSALIPEEFGHLTEQMKNMQ